MPNSTSITSETAIVIQLRRLLDQVRRAGMRPAEIQALNEQGGTNYQSPLEVEAALVQRIEEEEVALTSTTGDVPELSEEAVTSSAPEPAAQTYTSGVDFSTTRRFENSFPSVDQADLQAAMNRMRQREQEIQAAQARIQYSVPDPNQLPDQAQTSYSYSIPAWSRPSTISLRGLEPRQPDPNLERIKKMGKGERKAKRMLAMRKFVASRGLKGAEQLLRCGLEFEFHKLHGPNSNKFDETRFNHDLERHLSQLTLYSMVYHNKKYVDWSMPDGLPEEELHRRKQLKAMVEYTLNKEPGAVKDLPKTMRAVATEYETILRERSKEAWIRRRRKEYITPADSQDIRGWDSIAEYTQLGTDGSVRGGEIRTKGGRSIREFLAAARVLSSNNFDVDLDTSFHIHLSLNDVEHKWGERFQAEMYAYILKHADRLPKAIQERLLDRDSGQKYAKFALMNEHKYVAVYKHDDYNTWEFRLFGNVNTYKEMVLCLQIAVDTLRHVYAVRLGVTKSLIAQYGSDEITDALERIYDKKEYPRTEDGDRLALQYDDDGDIAEDQPGEITIPGVGLQGFLKSLQEAAERVRIIEEDAA